MNDIRHPTDLDELRQPPSQEAALVTTVTGTVDRVAANAFAALDEFDKQSLALRQMLGDDALRIKEGLAHFLLVASKAEKEAKHFAGIIQSWAADHARLVNKDK